MLDKIRNFSKFFLGVPLTIISFYFIFSFIYSNRHEILPRLETMNAISFTGGIIFIVIFYLLRSLAWKSILIREGYEVDTVKTIYLLSAAEIKRYIPGSVIGFISRINSFNKFGIPSKKIVKMIIYESILFLFTSILISIPGMFFLISKATDFPMIYQIAAASLGALSLIVCLALIAYFLKKYSANLNLLFKKLPEFKNSFLLLLSAWICFGFGNYLIGVSFFYMDPAKIIELSSFFVLSWLIGYVVIIAPLGLGVREAAVVYGLSSVMSAGFAAVISILLRIGLVAAELIFLGLSYLFYKYTFLQVKINTIKLILWSSIALYAFYFSYYSIQKHLNFFTGRFDLGNMDQTVWNTLHGNIFQLNNPNGTEIMSRLAIHADFILVLLAPFYIFWEDPRTLLIIQSVVLALGAYFIYKLSEHILPKSKYLPLIFSLSYLLNPWVQKQNLFDFHAITLATTFLLAAFYFMVKKKNKYFLIFLILAFLTKENLYLVGVIFGIYLTLKTKSKKWFGFTLACGFIFYLLVSKLMPAARGGTHFALDYFGAFGNSMEEIAFNAIFNPVLTFSTIFTPENINYLFSIFAPLGFLSLLSPIALIFAAPDFAINLLSQNPKLRDMTFHYAAVIIPFTYIAALYGAKNILKLRIKYLNTTFIAIFVSLSALFGAYEYGVLPGAKSPSVEIYTRYLPERNQIKKVLNGIPSDLKVAASNNLGAHLSHRQYIYTLPVGMDEADVVVMLLNDQFASPSPTAQEDIARELRYNEEYIELSKIGRFVLFAKRDIANKINTNY